MAAAAVTAAASDEGEAHTTTETKERLTATERTLPGEEETTSMLPLEGG